MQIRAYAGDSSSGHVYAPIYMGKVNISRVYATLYMIVTMLSCVQVHEHIFEGFNSNKWILLCMMVIEWREKEHEEIDGAVGRDVGAQKDLKICGLYKFWSLKGIRAQVRLLQFLVNYWNPETEAFNLDGKPLWIEVDNIYFITVLSH
jgi:hypothetical protein